jgi:hypothetical protein
MLESWIYFRVVIGSAIWQFHHPFEWLIWSLG